MGQQVRRLLTGMILCALCVIAGQSSTPEHQARRVDALSVYVEAADGQRMPVVIHREMELQKIPFTVKYSIPDRPASIVSIEWEVAQPPSGRHYKEFPILTDFTTADDEAILTFYSNRPEYLVTLTAIDDEGTAFCWTDTVRNEMLVKDSITLSTHGESANGNWRQVRAGNISLYYTTGNAVALRSDDTSASFVPDWPGNYWFEMDAESGDDTHVEVFVSMETDRYLPMRGIMLADYYGPYPLGNLDDEVEGAVSYVAGLGASAVWILNLATFIQAYPSPLLIGEAGHTITMPTLRNVASACEQQSLETFYLQGIYNHKHYITPVEQQSLFQLELKSESWYADFIDELRRLAMHHISMTQESGIDAFIPKYRAWPFYEGNAFENYSLDVYLGNLLNSLKAAFDGRVGWGEPNLADDRYTRFLTDADFIVLMGRPEAFIQQGAFPNPLEPTVAEIRATVRDHLDSLYSSLPSGIPVYIDVQIHGTDGQGEYGSESEWPLMTDWPEQIDYTEGYLQAVYETEWIDGIFFEVANWFDWDLHTISEGGGSSTPWGSNIRGVPVEEAIKMWFNILGGSN